MRFPALFSLSVLSIASAPHTLLGAVPAGFDDFSVIDVPSPTALAQLPDGRILVASQGGQLWLVEADGSPSRSLALDLSSRTCSNSERGLLGVEVDPDFADTRHVFVYYTFRRNGSCSAPVNRVSRFRMPGSTIDPTTETVLLDGMLSFAGNHNAGDIVFGKDGMLYVSIGDAGCDFRGDSGCAGQNDAARDRDTLLGKIARITRSGDVPADNPFQGAGTARCNQGNAPSGQICREIWATGLRNPFRLALDPNASATRIFVNDVGQNDWEEVDILERAGDYGWNVREGSCLTGSTTQCPPPPPQFIDPIHAYHHDSFGCSSITGGAFVPDGAWPAEFDGTYLFSDFTCGRIFGLRQGGNGIWQRTDFASDLGGGGPIAMKFLHDPVSSQAALFYTTYVGGGELRRIVREDGSGGAPQITLLSPAESFRFVVGQPISLGASAVDPEDGPLPGASITWTVNVRHDDHEHPYEPATPGDTLTVLGPAPENLEATTNSWLVVRVRAVDSDGQSTELERVVLPRRVRVTLATTPTGLRVRVNGEVLEGPAELISWVGYRLDVEAFAQNRAGTSYRFVRWSDGGKAKHTVVTPKKPLVLTAVYRRR